MEKINDRLKKLFGDIHQAREQAAPSAADRVAAQAQADLLRGNVVEHLLAAGVPPRIADLHRAGFNVFHPPCRAVDRFITTTKGTTLILTGAPGTGKSVAASLLLRAAEEDAVFNWHPTADPIRYKRLNHRLAAWVDASALAYANPYRDEGRDLLRHLARRPFAVIDELGTEVPDEAGRWLQKLDHVLNERYGRKLKTVITTNLDRPTFERQYKERISDRLRECGLWFACGNDSLRRSP